MILFVFAEQTLEIKMDVKYQDSFNEKTSQMYKDTYKSVSLQSHIQFSPFNIRATNEQTCFSTGSRQL